MGDPYEDFFKESTDMPINDVFESVNADSFIEKDKAACGVGLRCNIPQEVNHEFVAEETHELVQDELAALTGNKHRAGYNDLTEESDGSGIKLFSIPTPFFNQKIAVPILEPVAQNFLTLAIN